MKNYTKQGAGMQFTNPEIQKAFDIANDALTNHIEYVDNMNNDIKKLEIFLQKHLGDVTFDYDINLGTYLKFDKWFYIVNKHKHNPRKPLNECKLSVRMNVYKLLPEFITELGQYVKSNYNLEK